MCRYFFTSPVQRYPSSLLLLSVPYIEPPNSTYDEIDHETTYLSWDEITQEHIPGTLIGYHIKVRKYHETQFVVHSTVSKLMTLTGLKADTFYWVEITGYTTAGDGPEAVVVFKTPRGRKLTYLLVQFFGVRLIKDRYTRDWLL